MNAALIDNMTCSDLSPVLGSCSARRVQPSGVAPVLAHVVSDQRYVAPAVAFRGVDANAIIRQLRNGNNDVLNVKAEVNGVTKRERSRLSALSATAGIRRGYEIFFNDFNDLTELVRCGKGRPARISILAR